MDTRNPRRANSRCHPLNRNRYLMKEEWDDGGGSEPPEPSLNGRNPTAEAITCCVNSVCVDIQSSFISTDLAVNHDISFGLILDSNFGLMYLIQSDAEPTTI
ncbi:hypothetical protein EVAR_12377_1 [Eumeta japonica]|uniref:Uncharacterized protein n=1 Tax=Eumeta variegata TaxID=151549 RepID=A0A4C1U0G3_EUMVA|nr:hypothetical protein EVAR_12377_1 [Eumeta japonica]